MGRNSTMMMDQRCKKHPSHKQSRGVCPSCLREKLTRLSSTSTSSSLAANNSNSSASSSLSPYSSSLSDESSAASASPLHNNTGKKSFSFLLKGDGKALKKSRSLAFVIAEDKEKNKKKNKRGRFWYKLMGRRKDAEVVLQLHSKTMKEGSSSKWTFFP